MVSERFVGDWVARLCVEVPDAVAIFLGGSVVRGDAGPYSDVDFDVVVAHSSREEWPAWFDETGGGLVRVSAWIRDADSWRAAQRQPQEWAFFLPCAEVQQLRWAVDESWRRRLDPAGVVYPAGPPELDHFAGEVGKVANAWRRGDELAMRLAAHDLAHAVVSLLVPLNPVLPVTSRMHALRTLLDFDVAPDGYGQDMLTCMGLGGGHAEPTAVYGASGRLARGIADLLEVHAETFAAKLSPREMADIRQGYLRRWVEAALDTV